MLADDRLGCEREDSATPLNPKYADAFVAISRDPNQILTVVEYNGDLVGCMQLSFIPGLSRLGMWRGQIESVRIATGFRSEGIGRKMVEWAIAECRKRGCGLVQLTTDKSREEALQFYDSLGFRASHEGLKLDL
jgi:ribosomal protein S18 acetylase RimI-like enzyme